ncbi:C2 domain-containing protein Git1 [Schizosaccharomyces japonicus yFS275]|uniref:C2 domain-containing protein Git1 n=1 Tax=Schizosaccharomyces japonicus (strain yFS275 / FY16936) TaxID=402676 RepID=B6JVQ7_SCHJY|nr:C2 domain-containing protein Git1 [Schizosaccharomyces japonicus yFS275]EEB05458.2 C2 domain-containing protein Git1 [Schizosaccharomyces japonicus yFS275]
MASTTDTEDKDDIVEEPPDYYQWVIRAFLFMASVRSRRNLKQSERTEEVFDHYCFLLRNALLRCSSEQQNVPFISSTVSNLSGEVARLRILESDFIENTEELRDKIQISSFLNKTKCLSLEKIPSLKTVHYYNEYLSAVLEAFVRWLYKIENTNILAILRIGRKLIEILRTALSNYLRTRTSVLAIFEKFFEKFLKEWDKFHTDTVLRKPLFLLGDFSLLNHIKMLCCIFELSNYDAFLKDVGELAHMNVPLASLCDIIVLRQRITNGRSSISLTDFDSYVAFESYMKEELASCDEAARQILQNYPGIAEALEIHNHYYDTPFSSAIAQLNEFTLRPSKSFQYYKYGLNLAFQYNFKEKGTVANPSTWGLAKSFSTVWDIHPGTVCRVSLELAKDQFIKKNKVQIYELRDLYYSLKTIELGTPYSKWLAIDRDIIKDLMQWYHKTCLLSLISKLSECPRTNAIVAQLNDVLSNLIFPHPLFDGSSEEVTDIYRNFPVLLNQGYAKYYENQAKQELNGVSTNIVIGLKNLGSHLLTRYNTLKEIFPLKLFNQFPPAEIFSKATFELYLNDVCKTARRLSNNSYKDLSDGTMNDLVNLYHQAREFTSALGKYSFYYPEFYHVFGVSFVDRGIMIVLENAKPHAEQAIYKDTCPPKGSKFILDSYKTILAPVTSCMDLLRSFDWPDIEEARCLYFRFLKQCNNLGFFYVSSLYYLFCRILDEPFSENLIYDVNLPRKELDEKVEILKKQEQGTQKRVLLEALLLVNTVDHCRLSATTVRQNVDYEILRERPDAFESAHLVSNVCLSVAMAFVSVAPSSNYGFSVILRDGANDLLQTAYAQETVVPKWDESVRLVISQSKNISVIIKCRDLTTNEETIYGEGSFALADDPALSERRSDNWVTLSLGGRINVREALRNSGVYELIRYTNDKSSIQYSADELSLDEITAKSEDEKQKLLQKLDESFYWVYVNLLPNSLYQMLSDFWFCVLQLFRVILISPDYDDKQLRVPLTKGQLKLVYSWIDVIHDFLKTFQDVLPAHFLDIEEFDRVMQIHDAYFVSNEDMKKI